MQLHKNAKVELLKGVPLFAGCSKADLQRIASLADELDLGEGATLIREGERGREFIVVVDGTVQVTRKGKKLRALGAGDFIGEIALVADVPRTATVTATSPVRLLVVTDRAFKSLLDRTPAMATKVLQSLGERLHSDALVACDCRCPTEVGHRRAPHLRCPTSRRTRCSLRQVTARVTFTCL